METSDYDPSSPSQTGSPTGINSFLVLNAMIECPKTTYQELLKKPHLMLRKLQGFGIKFSSKQDLKEFDNSPFGKCLRKKRNHERKKHLVNFGEYMHSNGMKVSQILENVEPFAPEEVHFQQQRRTSMRFEIPVKPRMPDAKVAAKFDEEEKSDEEIVEPEPVKKVKTVSGEPAIVDIYRKLRQCEGDLDMVIDNNPHYGDSILTKLDYFEKFEKRVQSKIRQQIFQEWIMGIKFHEISVKEIKQSLREKNLKNINIRRELFFEKEEELKRLEAEKGSFRVFVRDVKVEEMSEIFQG